ncbi:alpha/Beta hydrolase fold protein [Artemisia annua]|uniref:Alpha/Beta hydrolase fold protein n=1 Tax=Artemisia annua TaxID=35608 RepID=A0A2U1LAK2_ARTAN|nr:alpha/Beta hydrolase fold protein [Artemisia annua]
MDRVEHYHAIDYIQLDQEKVGVWDLCLLLLHKHIGARGFINSSDDDNLYCETFRHRLWIFSSIVAIKFLKLISTILESFGNFYESSWNLWTQYGSFYLLILNTLRGKNVDLCRESPNFSSVISLIDTRLDLDDEISNEDPRYYSALAIMASKIAYENEARVKKIVNENWKMEHIGFYNCSNVYALIPQHISLAFDTKMTEKTQSTQAFVFCDKSVDHELICVSFRGTSPFCADDWCMDFDISWFRLEGIGKVHMGFLKALGLQKCKERYAKWPKEIEEDKQNGNTFAYYKIRELLREKLKKNKNARFMVTGHSLGGALAVLFPAILAFHNEFELLERLDGVYTFGQPRVGDDNFCRFMEDLLGVNRYFRFVYANDIIPRVPFDNSDFQFKHFGYCYHFNSFYNGQVVKEVPNKNYFSKKLALVHLNAVFELVRSLALPYVYGRIYKEGILLTQVRLFGLIFPGASAHCPQDYVNLTRLASPDIFYSLNYDYTEDYVKMDCIVTRYLLTTKAVYGMKV